MKDDLYDPINTKLPRYGVHHAGAERTLRDIGNTLKDGDEVDHGSMFYASSADRESMLKALKEFITKQEKPNE